MDGDGCCCYLQSGSIEITRKDYYKDDNIKKNKKINEAEFLWNLPNSSSCQLP